MSWVSTCPIRNMRNKKRSLFDFPALEVDNATLSRDVGNQLPSYAVSYPGRVGTSAAQLHKPRNSMAIMCSNKCQG